MEKEHRNQPQERRILLSLLFEGHYPLDSNGRSLLEPSQLLPRSLRSGVIDSLATLKKLQWIETAAFDSGARSLRLSENGLSNTLKDAKAILKTRFFLGLHPIPPGEAIELTTDSQVASALLLFIHFRDSTFIEGADEFLGIVDDGRSERLVSEFLSQRLIEAEDYPRFHETWYQLTIKGKERCECWLSGLPRPVEWPFRALPLASRRHNSNYIGMSRMISDFDIRALTSAGLELLAFEYSKRELRLHNIRHVGGPNDGKSDLLAEDHNEGNRHGVVLQCKQTSENSLRMAGIRKELTGLQVPNCEKPWKYILFTNAKDSRRLGDVVAEGTKSAGFIHSTVVSRTSIESFLADKNNRDLIPRFFPQNASPSSSGSEHRMPRRYEWQPSLRIEHFRRLLQEYFPDSRGQVIVRDLEYEDSYPNSTAHPIMAPSEWFKACVLSFDEEGLLYGDTCDGKLYRIPFESMVLWDQWTRDPWTGLPHLYVAGLDRIEPLNRSYGRSLSESAP